MTAAYFYDTYALLRILWGEPSYERFAGVPVITDHGCLYEFARRVLLTENAVRARQALAQLKAERLIPTDEDLVEAAKLQKRHSRLSAQDALGYTLARREGLTFLTGDRAFEKMPGVEFIE